MLNKIKRFLLRQPNVEFLKKSDNSESLYFTVGNSIIRVSDHIPTSQCRPEQIHILVAANSESFTILVNNRVAIIPNYTKLKEYIKFYILTVGIMGRVVHNVVTTTEVVQQVKEITVEKVIPVYRQVEGANVEEKALLTDFRRIPQKQRDHVRNQMKGLINSKEARKYRATHGIS